MLVMYQLIMRNHQNNTKSHEPLKPYYRRPLQNPSFEGANHSSHGENWHRISGYNHHQKFAYNRNQGQYLRNHPPKMKKHSSNHFKTSNEAAEERVEEHNRYLRNRKNRRESENVCNEVYYNHIMPQSNNQINQGIIVPRSRKNSMNQGLDSRDSQIDNVTEHFEEIQFIMSQQNQNLKQQNQYLLQKIHKMYEKQKVYKNQINHQEQLNRQLLEENKQLKHRYQETRDFMNANIHKIQKMMEMEGHNHSSDTSTSFHQYLNTAPIGHYQDILKNQVEQNQIVSAKCQVKSRKMRLVEQNKQQTTLDELSDRFDAIMFEYQKEKDPVLRRQCIELAKQIKNKKKSQPQDPHH